MSNQWWEDGDDVHRFGVAMIDAGFLTTPIAVADYFESPRKWSREYEVWVEQGRPTDPREDGWDEWEEAVHGIS